MSATEIISEELKGIILKSVLEGYAAHYAADLAEKVVRGQTEDILNGRCNGDRSGCPLVHYSADYKEGTQTATFGEATEAASEGNDSDFYVYGSRLADSTKISADFWRWLCV